eukprot:scaffold27740_cov66-Cyclotella_meneghiniana.AAC.1
MDRYLSRAEMTPAEILNCECDALAGDALRWAVANDCYINRFLPGEDIVVSVNGCKITGSYERAITRHWGEKVGRAHYHAKDIIPQELFDEVYWDGVEKHIIFCRDPARSAVFNSSVDTLVEWLASQRTDASLTLLLSEYLRGRGDILMSSLCSPRSQYHDLAEMVDSLGFRNILEGRIPRLFYDIRMADIKRRHLSKHAGHWCNGLILQLLQITHRQWTFRNGTVHLKGPDGLSPRQTTALVRRCEDLLWTDPSTLLDEDRYLLELDFDDLGDGTSASRQMWISEMEAAAAAARTAGLEGADDFVGGSYSVAPAPLDTEGSIRFRRRRRRRSGRIEYIGYSISRVKEE